MPCVINDAQDMYAVLTALPEAVADVDLQQLDDIVRSLQPIVAQLGPETAGSIPASRPIHRLHGLSAGPSATHGSSTDRDADALRLSTYVTRPLRTSRHRWGTINI
jgi:hypothetical protein